MRSKESLEIQKIRSYYFDILSNTLQNVPHCMIITKSKKPVKTGIHFIIRYKNDDIPMDIYYGIIFKIIKNKWRNVKPGQGERIFMRKVQQKRARRFMRWLGGIQITLICYLGDADAKWSWRHGYRQFRREFTKEFDITNMESMIRDEWS